MCKHILACRSNALFNYATLLLGFFSCFLRLYNTVYTQNKLSLTGAPCAYCNKVFICLFEAKQKINKTYPHFLPISKNQKVKVNKNLSITCNFLPLQFIIKLKNLKIFKHRNNIQIIKKTYFIIYYITMSKIKFIKQF